MLGRMGYQIDIAADGIKVLEALEEKVYDLVFMDVQMPEMDGLEATRKINEIWGDNRPTIIAMTANAMQGDKEMCLEAGMDDYVSKPIVPGVIEKTIEVWGSIALTKRIRT